MKPASWQTRGNMLAKRLKLNSIQIAVAAVGLGGALYMGPIIADNQSPSIVNGLSINALSNTEIEVRWNQPWDDTGIDGYNIYRDGNYYSTVRTTPVSYTHLTLPTICSV